MSDNQPTSLEAILDKTLWVPGIGQEALYKSMRKQLSTELNRLLIQERLDELKTLMAKHSRTYKQIVTDSTGNVYFDDSHVYISKYETQDRIAQLQSSLTKGEE